jgi:hypothetical protein
MNQIVEFSSFDQVIDELQTLNQTIEEIRRRIETVSGVLYGSQDARHIALEGFQRDIAVCGNWIRTLQSLKSLSQEKFGNNWDKEYQKLIQTNLPSGQAEDFMIDYLRNTLTTKVHFKIENLFSNILKALSANPKKGFWNISNAMLEKADIDTNGKEKNTLTALANLRNSYHANGMHNNDTLRVDIDGIRFEFCKGKRVECASWKHIVVILRANISVLESILFSNNVSNLRCDIPDDFAETGNP